MSNTTNFPFTKDEALATANGPLPAGIDQEEYEGLIVTIKEDGLPELQPQERDTITRVIEYQRSVSMGTPSPQATQDTPSGVEPGKEMGETETASQRLLDAPEGKPASGSPSSNGNTREEPVKVPVDPQRSEGKDPQLNGSNGNKARIDALAGTGSNPTKDLEEQIEEVRKLLAEGKEVPSGWTLTEDGEPIPPNHRINAAGFLMPVKSREEYEEEIADLKKKIEDEKRHLERDKLIPGKTGSDLLAKHKDRIKELKQRLKDTERMLGDAIANGPGPDVGSFKVYHNDGKYFVPSSKGGWFRANETAAKQYLIKHKGILARKLRDGDPLTQIDDVMVTVRDRHSVFWAGSHGGKPPQLMTVNGKDILILDGPKIITPVKGEFPIIEAILLGLLGKEQLEYFYGWMQWGLTNLIKAYEGKESRPGQFVCLVGPGGCGKNLLQERIITPIFGGRVAKPTAFFNDKSRFNAELVGAEHWMLSDETPARDIDSRRAFGNHIKGVASNSEVSTEVKHGTPVVLKPFRRGSVSLNNEEENIRTLPPLDDSIEGKIMLFNCSGFALPLPSGDPIETAIASELSALAYYLRYEHEIRSDLKDERYGIKAYHHPVVLEALAETTPERQLLQEIERSFSYLEPEQDPDGSWYSATLTATQIQEQLEGAAADRSPSAKIRLGLLFKHTNSCGTYLSRLTKQLPGRVKRWRPVNPYVHRIKAPEGWEPTKENVHDYTRPKAA